MKPVGLALLFCLCLTTACARLPKLSPLAGPPPACASFFARDGWQFVHIIEATPPGRSAMTLMGVVQLTPPDLHCALMTLEGLVLFEARWDGRMTVLRALPPFDNKGFAQGLVDDIRLIFLTPPVSRQSVGRLDDGRPVCRYRLADGETRDLVQTADGGWEMRCYRPGRGLTKTLTTDALPTDRSRMPVPAHMQLKTHGMLGYNLTLTLVEAQPLNSLKVVP
ncbi:conserved exported hypothetical protein [Desulfosarcina cetonica]|uniref:hypothetical protein n=1 Tax=Desulfosarcina cetonica TaxID=90730 RepID=UPI0006D006CE|nr:hypothetical protein [Desulfosarcina cetonica]VTR63795.1 conserved exported hypothetical protein [Desulfosarcina cetonica]